jgi:hypothetical protein
MMHVNPAAQRGRGKLMIQIFGKWYERKFIERVLDATIHGGPAALIGHEQFVELAIGALDTADGDDCLELSEDFGDGGEIDSQWRVSEAA